MYARLGVDDILPAVAMAQAMLNRWLPAGAELAVDGFYGPRTAAAVRACQARWGLPSTGVIEEDTWRTMAAGTGLRVVDILPGAARRGSAPELRPAAIPARLREWRIEEGSLALLRLADLQITGAGRDATVEGILRSFRGVLSVYGSVELHYSRQPLPVALRERLKRLADEWRAPVATGFRRSSTGLGGPPRFAGQVFLAVPEGSTLPAWAASLPAMPKAVPEAAPLTAVGDWH